MDLKFILLTLGTRTNSIFVTLDTCAEFIMILADQNNQHFDLFYLNVPKGIFILRTLSHILFSGLVVLSIFFQFSG